MPGNKFTRFMERQKKFEEDRAKKIEIVRDIYLAKEDEKLIFKPQLAKKKNSVPNVDLGNQIHPRQFEEFYKEQERRKM